MTWQYISGFFDADGSIAYTKAKKNERKTIQISFSNNERSILVKIQNFIEREVGCKGAISIKKSTNPNWKDSYELTYLYKKGVEVIKRIDTHHPKKRNRKNILLKIQKLKPRNGKYSDGVLRKIAMLESEYK